MCIRLMLMCAQKRKAQNRAAQRAFRERKEKHLKDLETKVQELEKASKDANNENTKLRAQVDSITTELNQYKQKLALLANTKQSLPRERVPFGSAALNNLSDVNFQFEFPKFGALPGPPVNKASAAALQPVSPQQNGQGDRLGRSQSINGMSPLSTQRPMQDDITRFPGIFTPSMTSSHRASSRASLDSANPSLGGGATSSPSASSNSNAGPSSSCGTSPEPSNHSPMGFKPLETLTTIGEEQPATSVQQPFAQFANVDISSPSFDWLANQNGGQFDPQLFGDYREPQDNVLANTNFDDFFSDALDADFFTPYNVPSTAATAAAAAAAVPHKRDLIGEIDAKQNSLDDDVPGVGANCPEIWYGALSARSC